jgi:hypothetical protein
MGVKISEEKGSEGNGQMDILLKIFHEKRKLFRIFREESKIQNCFLFLNTMERNLRFKIAYAYGSKANVLPVSSSNSLMCLI